MDKLYASITEAAERTGAQKVVLFGSRARGDHRERSDIDLAVFGMPDHTQHIFRDAVEDLPTLLDFDLVFVSDQTDPALLANIRKDGIILMDKTNQKLINLTIAVERLQEALAEYSAHGFSSMRDGVIQRFEFCVELAWKALREYLIHQGYCEINSPKAVMKQAYADGILPDEGAWLQLIQDRNLTSHIYDEATADKIYHNIADRYCAMLDGLAKQLSKLF